MIIQLSAPNISSLERKYINKCLNSNWVSSAGPLVEKFEEAVCKYTKAKHAVACVNGTSGLFIALKLCGAGPLDEIIVPTLTFIAPVNVIRYLGAEPVFMDCDSFMNLDVDKLEEFCAKECRMTKNALRNKKTGRIIKAVVPVHVFGNPCNMAAIMRIAKKFNLKVVEDATESLGSYYTEGAYRGKFTGTIGDFGVYSFNGNKIITTGSGGMIVSNHKELTSKARYLVNQAKDDPVRSVHNEIGYNFRLTNLQSALGLAQLEQLKKFIRIKKNNYELYCKFLSPVKGIKMLGIPRGTSPNYWFYSLLVEKKEYNMDREKLMNCLTKKNIQSRPIWYLNHLQRPYRMNQAYKVEKAPWFWERVLNLPCSTCLQEKQIKHVASAIYNLAVRN